MFYVLHGDDAFSRSEELAKLTSRMGDPDMADLNTTRLEGRTITWDELLHPCNTIPFLSDRRLVIVTGLLGRLAQKNVREAEVTFLQDLIDYLPELPDTTRLVFVEERQLPDRHPVLVLARESKEGYEKAFAMPTGNALMRWVQGRVKQEGGQIEPSAAQALCTFTENDLRQLHHEIQKLVAYVDGQRPIGEQDVLLLTPQARQGNIFHMVDALGRRDGRTASRIYHQLLSMGDHPLALLGMITRQFRLMVQVKELAPKFGTPQAIAREIHQNPYPIGKILSQSNNYTMEQLHAIYHKIVDTDVEIKTGRIEPTLALDMLIAGLSRIA